MANVTRKHNIHFMASDEERELIEKRMAQVGVKSLRAYLLKMASDGQIARIELNSVKEMVRLLSNATKNINQIAKRANTTGSIYAADIDELRKRYNDIWGQAKYFTGWPFSHPGSRYDLYFGIVGTVCAFLFSPYGLPRVFATFIGLLAKLNDSIKAI